MNIINYINKYWKTKTGNTSNTAYKEVLKRVKVYYPMEEWIVDLLEELLVNKIDIEKAQKSQWKDVDLKNNILHLDAIDGERKSIPLCKELKDLLKTTYDRKYIFEGLEDTMEKIGIASYFATGFYASELNDFYKGVNLTDSKKNHSDFEISIRKILLGGYIKNQDNYPFPTKELMYRISGCDKLHIFLQNGMLLFKQVKDILKQFSLYQQEEQLLDWGCGCGRVGRYFVVEREDVQYSGCDIDIEAIEWCNNNLKKNLFYVSNILPSLPFEDQKFTTVFGASVMTHINKKDQKMWLQEMHRVLKSNGLLILSVIDEDNLLCPNALREQIIKEGIVDDILDPALNGIAPYGYYRDVYQSKAYTLRNWSDYFDIISYQKRGLIGVQDLVIMRKKEL